jgi:hypothetical protein
MMRFVKSTVHKIILLTVSERPFRKGDEYRVSTIRGRILLFPAEEG